MSSPTFILVTTKHPDDDTSTVQRLADELAALLDAANAALLLNRTRGVRSACHACRGVGLSVGICADCVDCRSSP
jgi:hypothetical protein